MKNILAAAMMIAMGSLGVGCASSGPDEENTITVDRGEDDTASLNPMRPPSCNSALQIEARARGFKGPTFRVRFTGTESKVVAPTGNCCLYGTDARGQCLPAPPPPVDAPAQQPVQG